MRSLRGTGPPAVPSVMSIVLESGLGVCAQA